MNAGGGAPGGSRSVSTHPPLSLILPGCLSGWSDRDLARLTLRVGSCQACRPQTRRDGAYRLQPGATKRVPRFQTVRMRLPRLRATPPSGEASG